MFRFGLVFRLWTPVFRFCGWSSGYCLPVCRVAFRYLAPVGYLADLRLPVYGFIFRFTMVCSGCLLSFPDLRLLCKFGNTRHSFAGSPSSIFRFTIFWFPGFSDFMDVGWQGGPACRLTLVLAYLCHPCRFYLSSLPTSMSSLASDPVCGFRVWPRSAVAATSPVSPSFAVGTEASADVWVIPRRCSAGSDSVDFSHKVVRGWRIRLVRP